MPVSKVKNTMHELLIPMLFSQGEASVLTADSDAQCEATYDGYCAYIESGYNFYELTVAYHDSTIFRTVVMVSAILNAAFFVLMLWIDELRVHPMKLFMYLMACDSTVLFAYVFSLSSCSWNLPRLFAETVFFSSDCAEKLRALKVLTRTGVFSTLFASSTGVGLQICVCVDLILMIKSPFKTKESRMPWYYLFSCG